MQILDRRAISPSGPWQNALICPPRKKLSAKKKICLPCQCYLFDLQSQFTKYKWAPGYQLTNSLKTNEDLIFTVLLLC